ncbi:MAG: hypothetical protein JNK72_20435 [Myxococcales bacterium]|nr:hypothetical protein [Myxococcales bacterium]
MDIKLRRLMPGFVGAALLLLGCPNPNLYTTPRTIQPGRFQQGVAFETFSYQQRDGDRATLPALPTMMARYGISDQIDIGGRITALTGFGLDLKWNFLRSQTLDLAADPGFQVYPIGFSSGDSGGAVAVGYVNFPLVAGLNLGQHVTLLASAGFTWGFGSVTDGDRVGSFASGAIGRFGVGGNFRLSQSFALHPEVTVLTPADGSVITSFGIGLLLGGMPQH